MLDAVCGRHDVTSLHPQCCTFPLAELPHIVCKLLVLYHSTDGSSGSGWQCWSCLQHVLPFSPVSGHSCLFLPLLSHSCCCLKYLLLKAETVFSKPRAGNPNNASIFGQAIPFVIFPGFPFSLYILGLLQSSVVLLLYIDEKMDVFHLVAREARYVDF